MVQPEIWLQHGNEFMVKSQKSGIMDKSILCFVRVVGLMAIGAMIFLYCKH